ncbi:MAG: holo-ACP synthase [Gammaproteobacteria bacterium]|nr:holo-ACP synthase [Gammaproteobacteria bacterium]
MILGVGVDVVRVSRVQAAVDRFGVRFSRRILTGEELGDLPGPRRAAQFLAKRFAAKEALVKALGTGFRYGVGPRDIGVRHDPLGRPFLVFSPLAQGLLDARGVAESHLSLADEEDLAVAFVTLMRRPDRMGC